MSDSIATQPKPVSRRDSISDGHILEHVEKWMAMIREISREQQQSRLRSS